MIIKREFDFAYVDGVSAEMLGRETVPEARVKKLLAACTSDWLESFGLR